MIDRIEYHVEHAVDYVQTATQVFSKFFDQCDTGCFCAGHKEGAEESGDLPEGTANLQSNAARLLWKVGCWLH